ADLRSMSALREATTGATRASASFSSPIGTPNLEIGVCAPANTINRCNSAGGKTRHAARRPHDRSGSNLEEARLGCVLIIEWGHVRFRGQSGHCADVPQCPLLTQNGHRLIDLVASRRPGLLRNWAPASS